MAAQPWPTELRLSKDRKALTVTFDNGESFALEAEYLRVLSPSAEVQGHSPDQRYIRVATGLDYRDAAPVRGMRYGAAQENLVVQLQVQQ